MSKTIKDLGAETKAKNPGVYDDLTDEQLGRAKKRAAEAKGSHEYDSYAEITLEQAKQERPLRVNIPVNNQLDHRSLESLDFLRNKLKPKNGWFATWRAEVHSARNVRLIEALSANEIAVINHGLLLEKAAQNNQSELANFNLFLRTNEHILLELQAKQYLMQDAVNKGLSVEAYEEVRKAELLADIEIKKFLATEGRMSPAEKEKELSKIKIEEYEAKAKIDLDNETKSAHEKLRFEITAHHLADQKQIEYIQDLINQQYINISNTRADSNIPEDAKQPIIESIERTIKMYMEQQNEAQKRIIQSKA